MENPAATSPRITLSSDAGTAAIRAAAEIARVIRERAAAGGRAVLGLATGGTPVPVYRELVRLHREEGLGFQGVTTFNLDEYLGLSPADPRSYHAYMWRHLFAHVDVDPRQVHLPDGTCPRDAIDAHCRGYEEKIRDAGGIDIQLLGIGRNGHIGFNEPGSARNSRTRLVELDPTTRTDAARDFGGLENVPTHAISMGCGTILEARRIVLLACGRAKAGAVAAMIRGPVDEALPASFLQLHPAVTVHLDAEAATELPRHEKAPASGC